MKEIKILAIESSCDETAAAVVVNGREALSNVISSQIDLHTLYGGVVPEIASRKHIENINYVIEKALSDAGMTLGDIDAVGVTYGPGLVGALLVGVAEAKAICFAKKIPLIGVHHIEGHICANYVENKDLEPPFVCLVVSGGHTHLVVVGDYGKYKILGKTRDDAAGEAFDKVARAIGLGYPGGPKIDKVSKEGDPHAYEFPRAKITDSIYDFSFSGLKSAVLNQLNVSQMKGEEINQADVAASFQNSFFYFFQSFFFGRLPPSFRRTSFLCPSDSPSNISQPPLCVNIFIYFFSKVFKKFFKRRRRDLNPRAAINDLLPFQGSPFSHLGTSPSS